MIMNKVQKNTNPAQSFMYVCIYVSLSHTSPRHRFQFNHRHNSYLINPNRSQSQSNYSP
ncbi:hypothetical protein GYH30_044320 [Glycine max]|uniref:Uncharacterized protein n=1 Tax=Glycine max TaxID=3847 RepID=K7MFH6_SOYBN|nr:hypothetical protein GYH30_044320 [Glycine max]